MSLHPYVSLYIGYVPGSEIAGSQAYIFKMDGDCYMIFENFYLSPSV